MLLRALEMARERERAQWESCRVIENDDRNGEARHDSGLQVSFFPSAALFFNDIVLGSF